MIIKELRKQLNYSQSKVSKELNIPEQTLYGWENGNRQPNIENLIKLSNYYNVSIDELVENENKTKGFEHMILKKLRTKQNRRPASNARFELSSVAGRNVKWFNCCGRLCGNSSKR